LTALDILEFDETMMKVNFYSLTDYKGGNILVWILYINHRNNIVQMKIIIRDAL
jgi:hypothetical protein